jgi:hypothetical protein
LFGQARIYEGGTRARALVTEPVDDNRRVTLTGNTHPSAMVAADRGRVADALPVEHILLQLQRPAELEKELTDLIDEMHRPGSPVYQHWMTPAELGSRFGVAREDVIRTTDWLTSHGFRVESVTPTGMLIEFSGNAGQVRNAFHTEIHSLTLNGQNHIANMSDPQIPAALAGVVKGPVSLHNFLPHTNLKRRPDFTFTGGTPSGTFQAVTPADLATIYNLNPLFANGITGAGQTVMVLEDTLLANPSDVATFRSAFGLSGYGGSFSQITATGTTTCGNAGVNGDESEAALDAEWAGASAPGASIVLAACADGSGSSNVNFGGFIALNNVINGGNPPQIISMSYGECESGNGSVANAAYTSSYQLGVAQGVSVFASSGDEGAASCDANRTVASHGIAVSGFASSPYNVAVGGTDFSDTYTATKGSPTVPVSTYWNATNTSAFESALSYIPEIPWDDSCASQLVFTFNGYTQGYLAAGFCNSATGKADYRTTGAGSGGPSTYQSSAAPNAGPGKPSWQNIVGVPSDHTRDIPDISLFAANGIWNHFLLYCLSDAAEGGVPCTYTNSTDALTLAAGGTSFASPIMAGIMALVNQTAGGRQGNPNPRLYAMAASEYGTAGNSACNSSLGTGIGSGCFFNDVTQGDIDVNCFGSLNCFGTSGTGNNAVDGVLSVSSSSLTPAYSAGAGWDFATGIGSLNAYNFVNGWVVQTSAATVTSALSPVGAGNSVTLTATASYAGSTLATNTNQAIAGVTFTWSANTGCAPSVIMTGNEVATCITSILPLGSNTVTVTYPGDATHSGSTGTFAQQVNATVAPTVTFTGAPASAAYGATFTVATTTNSGATAVITSGGACSNTGNSITMTSGTGTCSLTATWPGIGIYGGATLTQSTNATPLQPTITFTGAPASAAYNSGFTVASTTNATTTAVISASGACSNVGSLVTMISGTGTCTVNAMWAADGTYSAATLTQYTTASKIAPTVTFTGAPATAAYQAGFTVASTTNASAVVSVSSSGACSSSGASVTMTSGTGSCSLTATWLADSNYTGTTLTQSTAASKIAPTVTFTGAPAASAYNATFAVASTTNASAVASIASGGACSNAGNSVTMTSGTGTCSLTATWLADSNYTGTTLTQSTTASKATPTVTFTGAPASAGYNATFTVASTTSATTVASIASNGSCSNSGASVTMTSGTGACSLTATWLADNNYSGATLTQSTAAAKIAPAVTFTGAPATAAYKAGFTVASTSNSTAVAVIASGGACSNTGASVTMTSGTGACSLTATWLADNNYSGTTLTQSTTASKIAPSVTFTGAPATAVYQSGFTVASTTNATSAATVAASGACSSAGGAVTMTSGSGTCSLTATWLADSNYNGSTLTQSTSASKLTPSVNWTAPAAIIYGSALGNGQLDATAGLPGTFAYTPSAGTVLAAGPNQTLSAIFTPTDTADYNTAFGSTLITVNAATNTPAVLTITKVLTRGSAITALITIANTGGAAAANVVLTGVTIGGTVATPLPQALGTVAPGTSVQATVSVPLSVGNSGAASSMIVTGTYTGGAFNSSARITLP